MSEEHQWTPLSEEEIFLDGIRIVADEPSSGEHVIYINERIYRELLWWTEERRRWAGRDWRRWVKRGPKPPPG